MLRFEHERSVRRGSRSRRCSRKRFSSLLSSVLAIFLCSLPSHAEESALRLAGQDVLILRATEGPRSPVERVELARSKIESMLADPECGPEGWMTSVEGPAAVIMLCSRRILIVTPQDAEIEGMDAHALAAVWAERLRMAFAEEKRALASTRLLRAAIVGLFYPLAFLGALTLVTFVTKRASRWVSGPVAARHGVGRGSLRVLATQAEQRFVIFLFLALRWLLYALLTYLFVVGLFRQFPTTARWAGRLLAPMADLGSQIGEGALLLVPRIIVALIILLLVRAALRIVGSVFDRVRSRDIRFEPILSPENAGHAELLARIAVIASGLFGVFLLVPGQAGVVLLIALGLAAFGLVLGAREAIADFVGGLAATYGRPIRRGQRVRSALFEGTLRARGLLFMSLEGDDGNTIVLPNRWILEHPFEVIGPRHALRMRIHVAATGGYEAAAGLIRHAGASSGLIRDDAKIDLVAVAGEGLVFDLVWPIPKKLSYAEIHSAFLSALLSFAPGLDARIVSARDGHQALPGA